MWKKKKKILNYKLNSNCTSLMSQKLLKNLCKYITFFLATSCNGMHANKHLINLKINVVHVLVFLFCWQKHPK